MSVPSPLTAPTIDRTRPYSNTSQPRHVVENHQLAEYCSFACFFRFFSEYQRLGGNGWLLLCSILHSRPIQVCHQHRLHFKIRLHIKRVLSFPFSLSALHFAIQIFLAFCTTITLVSRSGLHSFSYRSPVNSLSGRLCGFVCLSLRSQY